MRPNTLVMEKENTLDTVCSKTGDAAGSQSEMKTSGDSKATFPFDKGSHEICEPAGYAIKTLGINTEEQATVKVAGMSRARSEVRASRISKIVSIREQDSSNESGISSQSAKGRRKKHKQLQTEIPTERSFKVLLLGDPGTGKTAIAIRYTRNKFQTSYRCTIGVDFHTRLFREGDCLQIVHLYDISGQDQNPFTGICRSICREAKGAVIVCDVTRPKTVRSVAKWAQNLEGSVRLPNGSPIPCVVMANKCDLEESPLDPDGLLSGYSKEELNISGIFKTSAKTNANVTEAFDVLIEEGKFPIIPHQNVKNLAHFKVYQRPKEKIQNVIDTSKNLKIALKVVGAQSKRLTCQFKSFKMKKNESKEVSAEEDNVDLAKRDRKLRGLGPCCY